MIFRLNLNKTFNTPFGIENWDEDLEDRLGIIIIKGATVSKVSLFSAISLLFHVF